MILWTRQVPEVWEELQTSGIYRVKEEYLDCVFETIEKEYGSVEQFMKKALYMNPKTIEALRKKYLV